MFKVLDNKEVIYGNVRTKEEALEYIEECKSEDRLECDGSFHDYSTEEYPPFL